MWRFRCCSSQCLPHGQALGGGLIRSVELGHRDKLVLSRVSRPVLLQDAVVVEKKKSDHVSLLREGGWGDEGRQLGTKAITTCQGCSATQISVAQLKPQGTQQQPAYHIPPEAAHPAEAAVCCGTGKFESGRPCHIKVLTL